MIWNKKSQQENKPESNQEEEFDFDTPSDIHLPDQELERTYTNTVGSFERYQLPSPSEIGIDRDPAWADLRSGTKERVLRHKRPKLCGIFPRLGGFDWRQWRTYRQNYGSSDRRRKSQSNFQSIYSNNRTVPGKQSSGKGGCLGRISRTTWIIIIAGILVCTIILYFL
jgi:hypothetical protein